MTFQKTFAAASLVAAAVMAAALPALAQRVPMPQPVNLPPEVLSLACAPKLTFEEPPTPIRITGSQESDVHGMFGPGDLITINAGTDNGIEPGQEYFIRRLQTEANQRPSRQNPGSVRTAGWLKVYAVDKEMSLATVVHACDTIDVGDYLETFAMPVVPKVSTERIKPQRDNYGRILFGADFRRSFGKGDFFIVDRGSDHGVAPGDRFVIYRDKKQVENFLYDLGEAVAIEVHADTSTLQAIVSRDAFQAGDYVALRK
jgi:hypothetical protein